MQIGNGRINYINGYVSKDHDSVDVGLGEYIQKDSCSPWLATYRLLSKSSPGLPEVAIRMASLSEFDRSYSHVLLYPPQPAAMASIEGRQGNFLLACMVSTFRKCEICFLPVNVYTKAFSFGIDVDIMMQVRML